MSLVLLLAINYMFQELVLRIVMIDTQISTLVSPTCELIPAFWLSPESRVLTAVGLESHQSAQLGKLGPQVSPSSTGPEAVNASWCATNCVA